MIRQPVSSCLRGRSGHAALRRSKWLRRRRESPGGRILRTDASGSFFETFAAGFRNPYGFVFTRTGELITHESDMEWDDGEPWYRPTRLLHVVAGGEYGWRSGWGAWPTYFFDSLPSIGDTGRASPTAVVAYNHVMYPRRYQNTLFVGDWSRGRILNVRLKPSGASYTAETTAFLEGKPLNVTYLAVGPDGDLYFCTGGRDTEGGIYRVVWKGKVPETALPARDGMRGAIQQPQLDSAWARQHVAIIKQKLGAAWDGELPTIADNEKNRPESRCRALELMQLLGPFPGSAQLLRLSHDRRRFGPRKDCLSDGHSRRRGYRHAADRAIARSESAGAADRLRIAGARRPESDLGRSGAAVGVARSICTLSPRRGRWSRFRSKTWQDLGARLEKSSRSFCKARWRCW